MTNHGCGCQVGESQFDLWKFAARMATDAVHADASRSAAEICGRLSPRQREVLMLSCKGLTTRQVADMLHISGTTVEEHKYAIYKKMDVHTMVEAAVIAAKAGLV